MSLPVKAWSFQRKVIRQIHNRRVIQYFRDIPELDDDALSTGRKNIRACCLIGANDNQGLVQLKMDTFFYLVQEVQYKPDVYGMPVADHGELFAYTPQVELYFAENQIEVEEGYKPTSAQISFRLLDEKYKSVTPSEARVLAAKIKSLFVIGQRGYKWKKGRTKLLYNDKPNGYQLKIYCYDEAEGKSILNKILDIQGHNIDPDKLFFSKREGSFPTVPPTKTIYGKARRLPRQRPVANVSFRYAVLKIWGITEPIPLVDLTGTKNKALVEV